MSIKIKKLKKEDWNKIIELSVSYNQSNMIETSMQCFNDAKNKAYGMEWNFYGIYLDNAIIGFGMHGINHFKYLPISHVWLDRFMIDQKYQGKGYGKQALVLIIDQMFSNYECKKILLSVHEDNINAIELYKKVGFQKSIFKDPKGERIMIIKKASFIKQIF